jgi:hypothetical protein
LRKYNVASVRPEIVDPETTQILLTSTVKFDENSTTKSAATLKSEITTALNNYNTANLERFDKIFRYSKIVELIDDVDTSILSNITTIKMRKTLTPVFNTSSRYNIYFRNGIYNPHPEHKSAQGGVIVTSGFRILGDANNRVYYLDDDGIGNIRRYYLTGSTRNYVNNTQGTVNYATGEIVVSSLNISAVENIRGATSSVIEITTEPVSNDIVPVRDQIISIDTTNSSITVEADTFVGGSSDAGVGYTTTSSYN